MSSAMPNRLPQVLAFVSATLAALLWICGCVLLLVPRPGPLWDFVVLCIAVGPGPLAYGALVAARRRSKASLEGVLQDDDNASNRRAVVLARIVLAWHVAAVLVVIAVIGCFHDAFFLTWLPEMQATWGGSE